MTEDKFNNAINEFLFLTNSAATLMGKRLTMEVYEPQEVKITPGFESDNNAYSTSTFKSNKVSNNTNDIQSVTKGFEEHSRSSFTTTSSPLSSLPNDGEDNKKTITPLTMKKEFLTCTKCPLASEHRVLGEGIQNHPDVIVITDTVLGDAERTYLDTILKTIHLNPEVNTYITSLIKCESKNPPVKECYSDCSRFLDMQFSLYSPLAAIGFGIEASNYLRELKKNDKYKMCAFIFTRMPFDLKNNIEAKKKVWESFKKLAVFLKLPRI